MSEAYPTPSSVALARALVDPAMLEPDSIGTGPLFPSDTFDIRQQAEGTINNSGVSNFTVPLQKVLIVVFMPYGKRQTYIVDDTTEDWSLFVRLHIYGNNGADLQDTKSRFEFATQKRLAVFSANGIYDVGIDEHPRVKPYDEKLGLALLEYTFRFRWSPDI